MKTYIVLSSRAIEDIISGIVESGGVTEVNVYDYLFDLVLIPGKVRDYKGLRTIEVDRIMGKPTLRSLM